MPCTHTWQSLLVKTTDCIKSVSFAHSSPLDAIISGPVPPTSSHHLSEPFADCSGWRNNCCAETHLIKSRGAEDLMATSPYQHCIYWKSMSLIIKRSTTMPGVRSFTQLNYSTDPVSHTLVVLSGAWTGLKVKTTLKVKSRELNCRILDLASLT